MQSTIRSTLAAALVAAAAAAAATPALASPPGAVPVHVRGGPPASGAYPLYGPQPHDPRAYGEPRAVYGAHPGVIAPVQAACGAPRWDPRVRYMPGQVVWRRGSLWLAKGVSARVWNENSPPEWTPRYWVQAVCR